MQNVRFSQTFCLQKITVSFSSASFISAWVSSVKETIVKKLDFVRKFYRETNGICGVEMKKLLDQYQTDYRLDGIIKKMVTIDVPKYGRKLIGSKKVNLKMGSDYISKKIDYLTTGGNKMIEDFGWV